MSAEMELTGMDEILKWAEETGSRVSKAINPALTAGAEPILTELQHTSAFADRTGKLRKSFKVSKVKKKNGKSFVWVGDVDAEAPYTWPLERGTSRIKPHPFMRPAFERQKDNANQIMRDKIKEAIK